MNHLLSIVIILGVSLYSCAKGKSSRESAALGALGASGVSRDVSLDMSVDKATSCLEVEWDKYDSWTPDWTRYKHCEPITITQNNTIVSGCKFAPCYQGSSCEAIVIAPGVTGVQIFDNLFQGDYGGSGIVAVKENNGLSIFDNYFVDIHGSAIKIMFTGELEIRNNRFNNIHGSDSVDSHAVLLDKCVGKSIDVSWNRLLMKPLNVHGGGSWAGDLFSIYLSGGTSPSDRLRVHNNTIVGGSRGNMHADGIVVGDGCEKGDYVEVSKNRLINAGLHGITGSGGYDYVFSDNMVYHCADGAKEEWGPCSSSSQHAWVPDGCTVHKCKKMHWEGNQSHAVGIGNFNADSRDITSFMLDLPGYGKCEDVTQTNNNWQKADLTPAFIETDFMNWCNKDLHCPSAYVCRNSKCEMESLPNTVLSDEKGVSSEPAQILQPEPTTEATTSKCKIEIPNCANLSQNQMLSSGVMVGAVFEDDYEGSASSMARCAKRALDFAALCGVEYPDKVIASFYEGLIPISTSTASRPGCYAWLGGTGCHQKLSQNNVPTQKWVRDQSFDSSSGLLRDRCYNRVKGIYDWCSSDGSGPINWLGIGHVDANGSIDGLWQTDADVKGEPRTWVP